jgi:hypothetical protein
MVVEAKSDFPPSSNKRHHTGVADYFAILGVGEKLIWKHTQKQTLYQQENEPAEEEEEDEASLEERFYREIVEVAILAVDANTGNVQQQQQPPSAPASEASTAVLNIGPPAIPAVASYQSDTSHGEHSCSTASLSLNKDHGGVDGPNDNDNGSEQQYLLPNSPSHSEATTNTTMPTNTAMHKHNTATTQSANVPNHRHRPATDSTGWTRIEKTLPARNAGSIWVSANHQNQGGRCPATVHEISNLGRQSALDIRDARRTLDGRRRAPVQHCAFGRWTTNAETSERLAAQDGIHDSAISPAAPVPQARWR